MLALSLNWAAVAASGPKSVGCGISYYSMTGEYRHWSKDRNAFHSASVSFDFDGLFNNEVLFPGVSTSYAYDFCFDRSLRNGGSLAFYTGPGVTTGWVKDRNTQFGIMFGLKLDLGVEYRTPRSPLSIGAKINPTIGMHIHRKDRNIQMGSYLNGLISGMIPEFTVAYDFGRPYQATEGDREAPVFTYGAEASYNFLFFRFARSNWYDADGIRHYSEDGSLCSSNHFLILGLLGVNIGRNFNLSIASGYTTISYNPKPAIPLLLRSSVYFGKFSGHNRLYCYISGGPAFNPGKAFYGVPCLYDTGVAYRIALDRRSRLDFKIAIAGSFSKPLIDGAASVTLSREFLLGLNIGVSASF